MKIVATIEARMSSTRLPGKVLKTMAGRAMLERIIDRVRPARCLSEIVVATSEEISDDAIAEAAERMNIECFRGSLEDVLGRLTRCSEAVNADLIVKLSGDNPLYHYRLIEDMVACFQQSALDFLGTTYMAFSRSWKEKRTFPLGLGVAVLPLWVLQEADRRGADPLDRDSVVRYIIERPDRFRLGAFHAEGPWQMLRRPELRLTVDTEEDFKMMELIFDGMGEDGLFSLPAVIRFLDANPHITTMNKSVRQKHLIK